MDGIVAESVAGRTFQATLLILFGMSATLLAGVGVFGVLSSAVTLRSKELGIRLALGASPLAIQRMVLGSVFRLIGIGIAAGVPLALGAGYALRSALFGIGPQDLLVLMAACGLVITVGLAAAWLPTRRAVRIDPATTLRAE